MAKLLVFAVFLTLVIVGLCKNSSPENCEFILYNGTDSYSVVLVRMNITAEIKVQYNQTFNGTKFRTAKANFSLNCTEAEARLNGMYNTTKVNNKRNITMNIPWGENNDYLLTFIFQANYKSGSKGWQIFEASLSVNPNASAFTNPTYNQTILTGTITDQDKLIGKLDFERSYYCNSKNTLEFGVKNQIGISSMSAAISDFQVQAFEFDGNKTEGEYGNTARCSKDIKGSKIVPIAVGAALAGLVIIVLVAYIIGRLRSRKQSSYEALS